MALFEKALLGVTLLPLLIGCVELNPGLDEDKGAGSDVGEAVLMGAGAGPWEVSRGEEMGWEAVGAGRPVLCCSRAAKALLISSRSSVLRCSSDCFLSVMADNWCGAGLLLVGKLPDLLPSRS